jgi:hypothetical protein
MMAGLATSVLTGCSRPPGTVCPLLVSNESGLAEWSKLTILLPCNRAPSSHEDREGTSLGCPLSDLWCQAETEVRTEYWPAPHRAAFSALLGG